MEFYLKVPDEKNKPVCAWCASDVLETTLFALENTTGLKTFYNYYYY